ncbi:MAG: hypothetical protein D6780_00170 [Candidatus Dadabacteria bacterium]|nr:MAG: hypothetical protein D6780_00170 [Candidatus Dadabacteria bacterium]
MIRPLLKNFAYKKRVCFKMKKKARGKPTFFYQLKSIKLKALPNPGKNFIPFRLLPFSSALTQPFL